MGKIHRFKFSSLVYCDSEHQESEAMAGHAESQTILVEILSCMPSNFTGKRFESFWGIKGTNLSTWKRDKQIIVIGWGAFQTASSVPCKVRAISKKPWIHRGSNILEVQLHFAISFFPLKL